MKWCLVSKRYCVFYLSTKEQNQISIMVCGNGTDVALTSPKPDDAFSLTKVTDVTTPWEPRLAFQLELRMHSTKGNDVGTANPQSNSGGIDATIYPSRSSDSPKARRAWIIVKSWQSHGTLSPNLRVRLTSRLNPCDGDLCDWVPATAANLAVYLSSPAADAGANPPWLIESRSFTRTIRPE